MKRAEIEIINAQKVFEVDEKINALIEKTVKAVLKYEEVAPCCEVCVRLINNRQMRTLNAKMRDVSKTTDVLSFPSGDYPTDEDYCFLGDIAINLERAEKQRKAYGHSFEREIAFLTAHSCLHLLGYDHMVKDEEEEMFGKQEEILKKIGLGR